MSPDAVAPSWAETGQPSILQNPQVQLAVIVVGAIALVFVVWAVFFTSPSR